MYGSDDVEFMGILVDRQYTASQKYAQLVFETAEGIRLSLSRNISMVRSLRLGLTYKVKGPEHAVGQKRYVHEPTTTLVPIHKSPLSFMRNKILIPVAASLVVVLGGTGVLVYAAYTGGDSNQPAVHQGKPAIKPMSETVSPANTPANSQPSSDIASSQQQTRTVSTPSIKKSTPISPTTLVNTPAITNDTTAPVTTDESSALNLEEDTPPPAEIVEQVPEDTPPTVEEPTPDPPVTP